MKTLNMFELAISNVNLTIQESFNILLEGNIHLDTAKATIYRESLTEAGKKFFDSQMNILAKILIEEATPVVKGLKRKGIKLRKQISAMAKKRHSKKKVERASAPIFTVNLFEKMEIEAGLLLRRVGITPTETPILELMSISVEEAGFIFNTEELCNSLKAVLNMASKVLAV